MPVVEILVFLCINDNKSRGIITLTIILFGERKRAKELTVVESIVHRIIIIAACKSSEGENLNLNINFFINLFLF